MRTLLKIFGKFHHSIHLIQQFNLSLTDSISWNDSFWIILEQSNHNYHSIIDKTFIQNDWKTTQVTFILKIQ